ncbi:hypothetical protein TIFTF001_002135 [Ficus carica]|uniref:Uncharacterized protein n=1 Tax=Ficus carica TaxID=3494 RepID=A0AA88D6L9_FICCA|nr:hypothetical protein TIFTF001_002135 [Ficus carica]
MEANRAPTGEGENGSINQPKSIDFCWSVRRFSKLGDGEEKRREKKKEAENGDRWRLKNDYGEGCVGEGEEEVLRDLRWLLGLFDDLT